MVAFLPAVSIYSFREMPHPNIVKNRNTAVISSNPLVRLGDNLQVLDALTIILAKLPGHETDQHVIKG
jgi:hypothetical protein